MFQALVIICRASRVASYATGLRRRFIRSLSDVLAPVRAPHRSALPVIQFSSAENVLSSYPSLSLLRAFFD